MSQQSLEKCAQGGIFLLRCDLHPTEDGPGCQACTVADTRLSVTGSSMCMAGYRYLEDGHMHMAACALRQRLQLDGEMTCKSCRIYFPQT